MAIVIIMMMNRGEKYMELINSSYVTDLDYNTKYDEYFRKTDQLLRELPEKKIERIYDYER